VTCQDIFKPGERTGIQVCIGYGIKKAWPYKGKVRPPFFDKYRITPLGC